MDQAKWNRGLLIFGVAVFWLIAAAFTIGTYQAAQDYYAQSLRPVESAKMAWKPALGTLFQFGAAFAIVAAMVGAMRWMFGGGRG